MSFYSRSFEALTESGRPSYLLGRSRDPEALAARWRELRRAGFADASGVGQVFDVATPADLATWLSAGEVTQDMLTRLYHHENRLRPALVQALWTYAREKTQIKTHYQDLCYRLALLEDFADASRRGQLRETPENLVNPRSALNKASWVQFISEWDDELPLVNTWFQLRFDDAYRLVIDLWSDDDNYLLPSDLENGFRRETTDPISILSDTRPLFVLTFNRMTARRDAWEDHLANLWHPDDELDDDD